MAENSRKIQRRTLYYSFAVILIIAILISLINLIPFYRNLYQLEFRDLLYSRDIATLVIQEYILRVKEVARETSNDFSTVQLMQDYVDHKISLKELKNQSKGKLNFSIHRNPQIIKMERFDKEGVLISRAGEYSPIKYPFSKEKEAIVGPYIINHRYYVLVNSTIRNKKNNILGSEQQIFDVTDLITLLFNYSTRKLGDMLLVNIENNKPQIISPQRSIWSNVLGNDSLLNKAIKRATQEGASGVFTGNIDREKVTLFFAPIPNINWGIIIVAKNKDLLAAVENTVFHNIIIIIIVVGLFVLGLYIILKPLSGKVIFHISELKKRINLAKQKLEESNKKLEFLTLHDALTMIANRRGFNAKMTEEISRAKRHNNKFCLLYLDVDHFKKINDEHGHAVGDELLIHVANVLKNTMRTEDFFARIGGDEFTVLIPEITSQKEIDIIIHRLRMAASVPLITKQGLTLHYSFSIGLALFPDNGKTTETLLKQADINMYCDKHRKSEA
ncbi:MAG: hypothetical protein A3F10_06720 [Coxiella sp. RIFCSPHIGHO2_12_FULL_42_15]|nr:MAG: hypothetical protein A3F10_06720 [Coxiella sp. RIFCSPHIGHO2_12_FULL_42_15]